MSANKPEWVITELFLAEEKGNQFIYGHVKKESTGGPWNAYAGNVFIGEFDTKVDAQNAVIQHLERHWPPALFRGLRIKA